MKPMSLLAFLVLSLPCWMASTAFAADSLDWVYWRGPEFNSTSRETGLPDDWNPAGGEGSNLAWKRDDLGGRSTPIVMNGRLYTLVRADPGTKTEGEKVVCIDATSGKTLWENRFNVYLSDVPDTRVGWSSVVGDPETGKVYALGVCGLFLCIDGATGETLWEVPMHEQFGLLSTYGGRTNFPIVFEDLVIVSAIVIGWGDMARPSHRFLAFDKETGDVVWFNSTRPLPDDTTYSAPAIAVIDGQQSLVVGAGDGSIWSMQPRTGNLIWEFPISRRGVNTPPLIQGNIVYAGQSEENVEGTRMGAIAAINAQGARGNIGSTGKIWQEEEVMAGKTSPLLIGNHLWIFNDSAKLGVFDAETGKSVGRKIPLGTVMRSSPLHVDGKVYAVTVDGRWYILAADDKLGAKILKKGRLPAGEESHGSPICSHGRIYIPTTGGLYCLFDAKRQHGAEPIPQPPQEPAVTTDMKPAHLQVVPVEVLMKPGETQQFTARLFNARGQLLKSVPAKFELDGPGQMSVGGEFTASSEGHVATIIKASAEGLEGTARIRVVPSLPWHFDFDQIPLAGPKQLGEPPITWVGARYRNVIREVDGSPALVKITTIPKGTRSRCWMGQSDLHDYTIQADVRGAITDGKLPDIGLIAQGYTLDLQGAEQKLEVRTWDAQRRMARAVEFPWEPNRWYTMKLRASRDGARAVLQGKIWPRGTAEPTAWNVEAEDLSPNLSGSPGLYGNAKDAELYLDNIHVTANND